MEHEMTLLYTMEPIEMFVPDTHSFWDNMVSVVIF